VAIALPDKPSIAVLPFTNMSDDPKQEYFSDGMAEDLITDLSKISGLFVIARNSVFQYKGKPVDIKRISRELGVRYVLEGSVRRAEEKIRINAQLIDASTGGHLWAERYDGTLEDVFSLQDKITAKIVAALAIKLGGTEAVHLAHKGTRNTTAYDAFLQGWAHYIRLTPKDFADAVPYFEKAVELDPQYGRAYAALASVYWESFYLFWHGALGISWNETRDRADKYIREAMRDPTPLAHLVFAKMLIASSEHERALETAEKAVGLDPNDPNAHLAMAYTLIYAARPREAIDFMGRAMRLDPHYPPFYLHVLGLAYFGMERFEEAAAQFERALARNPENYVPRIPLASAYAHLGRLQEAESTVQALRKAVPMVTLSFLRACPLWKYKDPADKGRLLKGMEKAGLPHSMYDLLRPSAPSAR
jgi:TolB-like protein/Flp pilus assembly protein TadD